MGKFVQRSALLVGLCISGVSGCGSGSDSPSNGAAGNSGAHSGGADTGGNSSAGKSGSLGTGGTSSAGATSAGGTSTNGGASAVAGASGSSATAGNAGAAPSAGAGGAPQTGMGPFPSSAPFYQDISKAMPDAQSSTLLDALNKRGWGDDPNRTTLGVDFSFNINLADANVAKRAFTKTATFFSPDCDTAPVPLPAGGKGEGVDNYACTGDDCHLLVYQGTRYYELYQSNITGGMATGGTFKATCLVVWDLSKDYWAPANPPNFSRGDGCTGADAADLPIAPLVLTKEDLMSGTVKHALRFTIDNNRIASSVYVHPATHLGGPTGDDASTLPYGARLRLRGDFNLASLANDHARAVAKALQTYGMYLADGGNSYVSATTDASDLINNAILTSLKPSDFQMVDGGARIDAGKQDCKHVPLTQ